MRGRPALRPEVLNRLDETFSDMPRALCENSYRGLTARGGMLSRERLEAVVATIGREHIDGWDEQTQYNGRHIGVRAIGVPTVHVIAGNAPGIATITFLRNALIRGYALVKIPSNELGAAIALGKTLLDMAPDHPLTRSWSAAYWRGGDTAPFEELIKVLAKPFEDQPEFADYATPPKPEERVCQTFCGT